MSEQITLESFFVEKLGNLHSKLENIQGVQDSGLGPALLAALKDLQEDPRSLLSFFDIGLRPYTYVDEDTNMTCLDRDMWEQNQLDMAKELAKQKNVQLEEVALPKEAREIITTYFDCFVDVYFNNKKHF